jgi:hypothetical protein
VCQLRADACGRYVVAGPIEATALDNLLVQAVAPGTLPDIAAGRAAMAMSSEQTTYEPRASADWDAAIVGFDALVWCSIVRRSSDDDHVGLLHKNAHYRTRDWQLISAALHYDGIPVYREALS